MDGIRAGDRFVCVSEEGAPAVIATVGRVERCEDLGIEGAHAGDVIVHVSTAPLEPEGPGDQRVCHGPYALEAFARCAVRRLATGASPDAGFEDGYATWREMWDRGEAGWFTVSPADVAAMIAALTRNGTAAD